MDSMIIGGVLDHDPMFGGSKRIRGTVDELGAVGAYPVRLHARNTGICIAEAWSSADGSYEFGTLNDNAPYGYYVCAFDHGENPSNAAISDQLIMEPMR